MGDWALNGDWATNGDWADVGAVWDDAVFLWNPGDAETASSDLVTEASASGVTEGSIVTHSGRTGRSYSGAVGSRFAAPITNLKTTSWTMFMVARMPSNGLFRGLNFANSGDSDRWAGIWPGSNDANRLLNFRLNGSSVIGNANWPAVTPTDLNGNTDFVVYVMRYTRTDNDNGTLEGFEDSSTAFASDTLASSSACDPNRLTVGRLEDSSPTDSGTGEAYAAGVWNRAITEAEIDEILADPFGYFPAVQTSTHTTDAFLVDRLSLTHTTDVLLVAGVQSKVHTTDALVLAELEILHTTDALLVKRVLHTTDAYLRGVIQKTHTTDAVVFQPLEFGQHVDTIDDVVSSTIVDIDFDGTDFLITDVGTNRFYHVDYDSNFVDASQVLDDTGTAGIAFDGTDVWVSNVFDREVRRYLKSDGTLLETVDTTGYQVQCLEYDPRDGTFWMGAWDETAEMWGVFKFDTGTEVVTSLFASPNPVADSIVLGFAWIDPHIWVLSGKNNNNIVYQCEEDGTVLAEFAIDDALLPNNFSSGMTYDGEYLWVGDAGGNRLLAFFIGSTLTLSVTFTLTLVMGGQPTKLSPPPISNQGPPGSGALGNGGAVGDGGTRQGLTGHYTLKNYRKPTRIVRRD